MGGCFSSVEILTALYFGNVLRYDTKDPQWRQRDRFILSKGHASAALYTALAYAGFLNPALLDTYCQPGSILGGHPKMHEIPGVEASTGALGHGLVFAEGIALAGKMDGQDWRVFALVGDGECQEGSIWEAAMFAAQHSLGNLTAIIDYNGLQAMDHLDKIIGITPLIDKWKAFGWDVVEVDGHNVNELINILGDRRTLDARPRVVLAHTIKGKGVSFMENEPLWHFRLPNEQELEILKRELGFSNEEWQEL